MITHPFSRTSLGIAMLALFTAALSGCGGGGASSATLSESSIQLPSQVQVVSSK